MSDSNVEASATPSQKPVPRIKDVSMMKAWKDSKVGITTKIIMKKKIESEFLFHRTDNKQKYFLVILFRRIENIYYLFNHSIELCMA